MKKNISIYLFLVSVVFGAVIVTQSNSVKNLNELELRDNRSNIFQEIMILKQKNEDLREEISELEDTLNEFDNDISVLESVEDETKKYRKLSGEYPIFGSGVKMTLKGPVSTPLVVDLVNELFNVGAQAVSVNGIRITNRVIGFESTPLGQLYINGSLLSEPYELHAIGKASVLEEALETPGGLIDRLDESENFEVTVEAQEVIQMD